MGGSAIGGALAAAALGDGSRRRLEVVRGYELAPWLPPEHAVLCSSYSGNTEETLACFDGRRGARGAADRRHHRRARWPSAARADGVPVIGIPSGLQPRAAVGYMFTVAAEVAALVGAADAIRTEIDSSAAHIEAARRCPGRARAASSPARSRAPSRSSTAAT